MKTFKYIIVALLFFIAGFLVGQSYQVPTLQIGSSENKQDLLPVTYVIAFSPTEAVEFQEVELNQSISVLDLLLKLADENELKVKTQEYADMGTLVTAINEYENGQAEKYWQYYVNDQSPQIGAQGYNLSGGERVEWRFTEFEEEF